MNKSKLANLLDIHQWVIGAWKKTLMAATNFTLQEKTASLEKYTDFLTSIYDQAHISLPEILPDCVYIRVHDSPLPAVVVFKKSYFNDLQPMLTDDMIADLDYAEFRAINANSIRSALNFFRAFGYKAMHARAPGLCIIREHDGKRNAANVLYCNHIAHL